MKDSDISLRRVDDTDLKSYRPINLLHVVRSINIKKSLHLQRLGTLSQKEFCAQQTFFCEIDVATYFLEIMS